MSNIRLLIEYQGTNYCGWQIQSILPTVQGTIEEAIRKVTGERVKLYGASRTDAGVHALGQVANFTTVSTITGAGFAGALNLHLPLDIVIKESAQVSKDFHSSIDAKEKLYIYTIERRRSRSVLSRDYAWFYFVPLDVAVMREGAKLFIGKKDFSSFKAKGSRTRDFVREIYDISIVERGDFLDIYVRGRSFLRHMVRIIIGTLVTLGKGKLELADIDSIINGRDRSLAAMTAPPHGLCLVRVGY